MMAVSHNNNNRHRHHHPVPYTTLACISLTLLLPTTSAQFLNIDVKIEGTEPVNIDTQRLGASVAIYSQNVPVSNTILLVDRCSKGTYSNKEGTLCIDCPAGTKSDTEGASTPMACNACSTGSFSGTASSVCTDCQVNTFSTTYMAPSRTQCLVCPPRSTSPTHSNQVQDCVCDSGYFMSDNILTPFDSILASLGFEGALSINIPHVVC